MNWGVELAGGRCPYCGEPVQLVVDASEGPQSYVEDCPVCCRPMTVVLESTDPLVVRLRSEDDV